MKCGRVAEGVDERLSISLSPSGFGAVLIAMGFAGFLFFAVVFDSTVPLRSEATSLESALHLHGGGLGAGTRIYNMDLASIRLFGIIASVGLMIFGRIPSSMSVSVTPSRRR
jgi:hypothetical protein